MKKKSIHIKLPMVKNSFELSAWAQNRFVVGIDEVGRGCLAGPVVAAAVILPINTDCVLLKDSKILMEKNRIKAFEWIEKNCWYQTAVIHHRIIDRYNIYQATLSAMKKSLLHVMNGCSLPVESVLVDAMPLEIHDLSMGDMPVYYFYHGEKNSISIAAASIVAKVKRDMMMNWFDDSIPGYALSGNKGYATQVHRQAIISQGQSVIHRSSYLKNIYQKQEDDAQKQLLLTDML